MHARAYAHAYAMRRAYVRFSRASARAYGAYARYAYAQYARRAYACLRTCVRTCIRTCIGMRTHAYAPGTFPMSPDFSNLKLGMGAIEFLRNNGEGGSV